MKTQFLSLSIIALSLAWTHGANAQTTLEYGDGPTSRINQAQLDPIFKTPINPKVALNHLLTKIRNLKDPSEVKQTLFRGLNDIQRDTLSTENNLIFKHSIKAGLELSQLIHSQTIAQGKSRTPPGTIRQQIRIMKKSVDLALGYYESDESYVRALRTGTLAEQEAAKKCRTPDFIKFGKELTKFIIGMSDGVLNIQAAYGMVRWSIGVFENYMLQDRGAAGYADTIRLLDTTRGNPEFPDLMQGEKPLNDLQAVDRIMKLKLIAKQAIGDLG